MKLKLPVLLLTLIFISIFGSPNLTPYKDAASRDSIIVNNLINGVAQKLFLKENLYLVGSGSQMMNEIDKLLIKFDYAKEVQLANARHLLVTAIQTYLEEINQNKEIRRYLKNYPFTSNNIEIGIYIHNPDGSKVSKNKLFYVSAIDGVLCYYLNNIKGFPKILLHQETYEEALKASQIN